MISYACPLWAAKGDVQTAIQVKIGTRVVEVCCDEWRFNHVESGFQNPA
jgi:hypothetical protein